MGTTTHLMTAEELLRLPDDGLRHELIKGELLTMPPLGEEHGAVTMNLSILLLSMLSLENWEGCTLLKRDLSWRAILTP